VGSEWAWGPFNSTNILKKGVREAVSGLGADRKGHKKLFVKGGVREGRGKKDSPCGGPEERVGVKEESDLFWRNFLKSTSDEQSVAREK